MQPGQVLFTYLHLAAEPGLHPRPAGRPRSPASRTRPSQLPTGALPLLAPMSEVAGRLAPQVGAYHLMRQGGGRGHVDGRRVRASTPRRWW